MKFGVSMALLKFILNKKCFQGLLYNIIKISVQNAFLKSTLKLFDKEILRIKMFRMKYCRSAYP